MALLIVLFTLCGALMVGLGVPLVRRRVRPNPLYGLRVPATFADERVWYEANAASGRDMIAVGAALVAVALGLPLFGVGKAAYAAVCGVLTGVGSLGFAVVGWRRADRLLREFEKGGGSKD